MAEMSGGEQDSVGTVPAQPAGARAGVPGWTGTLSPADLAQFAEMLAGLVRAKLPLPDALKLLVRDTENRRLREALASIEAEIAAGGSLPEALRRRADAFPELFTRLIESGCAANDLHAALVEIVREYRAQTRFREALWGQLLGPLFTVIGFGGVLLLLLLLNVPRIFADTYRSMHLRLPFPTVVALKLNMLLCHPGMLVALVLMLAGLACIVLSYWRRERYRLWVEGLALRAPVLGPYLRTVMLAQFCRLSSILLRRNLPLGTALDLTGKVSGFLPMQSAVARVAAQVDAGADLAAVLESETLFPPTFCHFIRGAQVHGELPETLSRLAEMHEDRSKLQGTRLHMLVYAAAVLAVGACAFWLILSCFLPVFRIQEALF